METTVLTLYFFFVNVFTPAPKEFRKEKMISNHSWKWEYIGKMNQEVKESSGLCFVNDTVYTHGDSGQKPVLWAFSLKDLESIKTIPIPYYNVDWEDICFDRGSFYISDAGNNLNERLWLKTIKVPKQNLDNLSIYSHKYEDQHYYPAKPNNKNFDAEAMFIRNESLFLISKNRSPGKVKLYQIPKKKKDTARIVQYLPVDGSVTGADYNATTNRLAVLSYAFVYEFDWSEQEGKFIPYRKKSHSSKGQTEGICYINDHTLLISNEKGKLFLLKDR